MEIITSIERLKSALNQERLEGHTIGLVPTMGALHEGHISLVKRCVHENDVCVVSVFVNPTQFNDKQDLATYPRKPKQDCDFLEQAGCRYAFLPSVKEMYPEPDTRVFHLGKVAEIMEGAHRPGHFNGVAQIVSKLFFVVQPSRAYFGRKDFQQIAVIRAMVKELGLGVEIVPCPIVREVDGLAMSSRNQRLSPEERKAAPLIHAALVDAHEAEPDLEAMKLCVQQRLSKEPLLRVEYFEIVDEETLAPLTRFVEGRKAVGCIAVYCGAVRLIDNETYNN